MVASNDKASRVALSAIAKEGRQEPSVQAPAEGLRKQEGQVAAEETFYFKRQVLRASNK